MNERQVVGFDGSAPSRDALRWALGRGTRVTAAYVAVAASAGRLSQVEEDPAVVVDAALEEIAAAGAHDRSDIVVLRGPVEATLADYCLPGDTLVIGTHKTGFVHGRINGFRGLGIARLARYDVAVVPPGDLRFRSGVVAGVVGGPSDPPIVRAAAREAMRRRESLLLLHATASASRRDGSDVLAQALGVARQTAPSLVVRTRVANRPAADLLLDSARDRALLVVGSGTGDTRSSLGAVLLGVLLNISAPVLVVHPVGRLLPDGTFVLRGRDRAGGT